MPRGVGHIIGHRLKSQVHLVVALHFHQAPGVSAEKLDRAFDEEYGPLVTRMEADPHLRLNLHFTGTLLEHAVAHRPEWVARLKSLWKEQRVELLGGAFHDALMAAIPERDALGQLQFTSNFFAAHFGHKPTGAWLSLRAWDPSMIRTLVGAGVEYTLLDDAQFVLAGLPPDAIRGHFVTERAGHCISIFPIDAAMQRTVFTEDRAGMLRALKELAAHANSGSGVEGFAGNGEELIRSGQLDTFLDILQTDFHWVKTYLLAAAKRRFPDSGRVYLPTSAQPGLGDYSRPAAAVERRRSLIAHMERLGVWQEAQQLGGGVVWDNFLVKYPEVNLIHKRMLRVSSRVDRLRSLLRERQEGGKGGADVAARKVLQAACGALWRAQNHSVYWHGGDAHEGIYDPQLRRRFHMDLLRAEALVDKVLTDRRGERFVAHRVDLDADGVDEALVVTPHFYAVVHPKSGGSLWELDLRQYGICLQTSLSPVEEPYHASITGTEVQLVNEDEERRTMPHLPVLGQRDPPEPALRNNHLGPRRHGAFFDHIFGAETTLQSFAKRQFREIGDFADEPYDLVKIAEPTREGGPGSVTVTRAGVAREVDRALLLRLEKTYRFGVARPILEVEAAFSNRSRDPAAIWYGMEWSFGLPSGSPKHVHVRAVEDEDELTARLTDGPVDLGLRSWIDWADDAAGLAITMELARPMSVWWVPIRTVHLAPSGWREVIQGNTLLFHDQIELWGEERMPVKIKVAFHKTR